MQALVHAVEVTGQCTTDTPQSQPCGFVAQSVQQATELIHGVIGGGIGEDGQYSICCWTKVLHFHLHQINSTSKWCGQQQQQLQIDTLNQK